MVLLRRAWALFALALKRLYSQRWLTLASIVGVASAVVLVMSVPIYVDAAFYRLLREELGTKRAGQVHSPFAFVVHYVGAIAGPLSMDDMQRVDDYLSAPVFAELGLPQELRVRSLKSDRLGLFPADALSYENPMARLMTVRLGHVSGIQEHIIISEGAFPALRDPGDLVDVLVAETVASKTGISVGETFTVFLAREPRNIQFPVRVAGLWRANDPNEVYWFRDPDSFDDTLLVPEETLRLLLNSELDNKVQEAVWYLLTDGSQVRTSDIGPMIVRILRMHTILDTMLPRVIVTSPLETLQRYYGAERSLTTQLYIFSIPIIVLNLIFTTLVAGMAVQRRRVEIAVLRSRGASLSQIVGVAVLESLVIGLLALGLALPGSLLAAQLATRTRDFMDLSAEGGLSVALNEAALRVGLWAIGFALLTQVLPNLSAARHTIVTYKHEVARMLRPPLWQRLGLDVLLLIPAGYGTYLLREQGNLFLPLAGATTSDPFQNPLLVLVPALTILAATLLLIRILPLAVRALAWLVAQTKSLSFLLAFRHLSRSPGFYAAPMVLLIMTLGLSVFFSSTAQTLDAHLYDQTHYQFGADMIAAPAIDSPTAQEGLSSAPPGGAKGMEVPGWYAAPLADYLEIPGVHQAARVDRYSASLRAASASAKGTLLAIDPARFGQIAFWRAEYALEPLGNLLNRLEYERNGVLMPWTIFYQQGLRLGDSVRVIATIWGQEVELVLKVVGGFDLFPTWSPQYGPLFVMNLSYLHESVGIELPSWMWLKLEEGADTEQVVKLVTQLNPQGVVSRPYYGGIAAEHNRPERQGLLGILSLGFGAAALLATIGFLLYAAFSFQRRAIELGVLRSIGLTAWQLTGYLAWELVFLVLIGLVGGTALGILISETWIPYFKVGSEALAQILPMPVRFSVRSILGVYALFGAFLIAVFRLSVSMSRKLRLFEMIKMAETT